MIWGVPRNPVRAAPPSADMALPDWRNEATGKDPKRYSEVVRRSAVHAGMTLVEATRHLPLHLAAAVVRDLLGLPPTGPPTDGAGREITAADTG